MKSKLNTAFGKPKGTVRALITILLVLAMIGCGFLLVSKIGFWNDDQFKLAFMVFTVFNSAAMLMLGNYIKKT